MKLKKVIALALVSVMALSLVGCGAKKTEKKDTDKKVATSGTVSETTPMVVNKDKKEVQMYTTVNGTYFTEDTRHGIVYKGGSNGDKSVLKGFADEKEFYQALVDIGAKPGNNLTAADMAVKNEKDGKSVEGDKLDVTCTWEGQSTPVPFADIITCTAKERPLDIRFGGNLASAKKNNTGCVLCLDSCATGITSNAAWPTGSTMGANVVQFHGNKDVLPKDGTPVIVTFKLA
ncbi:MAG: YdjY domain-containing protein [Lachnospiraceae bacterium]|nr:YdjY domain-containing protein [Lachnospiraceae bacterium]